MTAYVYRAFNAEGVLLYVGSSINVAARIRAHYLDTPWWFAAKRFTFDAYDTVEEARAAEKHAIATEFPRWNIDGRSPDHPDGCHLTRRDVARLYPEDDRRRTHPHVRTINEGRYNRARLVEVAS